MDRKIKNNIEVEKQKEVMLEQLRQLAKELGRKLKDTDIIKASSLRKCASITTFQKYFGGVNRACKAIGLECSKQHYSKEQLIEQLKKLTKMHGRLPTGVEVTHAAKSGEYAKLHIFTQTFGSLRKAFKAAGFKIELEHQCRYTSQELIIQLQNLTKRLGRIPGMRDVDAARKEKFCTGYESFKRIFGNLEAARKAANLELILKKLNKKP